MRMDAISSCVVPLRSLPALPPPPPPPPSSSSTSCYRHHRCRGSLALSSFSASFTWFFPPDAAVSSRLLPPPAPLLRRRTQCPKPRSSRRASVVASAQFNVVKVLANAWRVAKDGVEAGTNFVPDSVPRPIARICVAGVAATLALFLLKTLLSTALFVLAMMGLIYFTYIAFNAGEGPSGGGDGGGGTTPTDEEETLEEARRIMEKYK